MMKKIFLLLLIFSTGLAAGSKYPVDVTYLVADLKYSKEFGVKICEIQHGILSTFKADVFLNGEDGLIAPRIVNEFARFPFKKWTIPGHIAFSYLRSVIGRSLDWEKRNLVNLIWMDPEFLSAAALSPEDPYDIFSYHGMLYVRAECIDDYEAFHREFPGIILIDAASHPYWVDKYQMSLLFGRNPGLSKIKPEWKSYPKEYSAALVEAILNDIPSDVYVIKPRGAFLGDGVIIISKEDLDKTLRYILDRSEALKDDPDHSYNYWNKDPFDSFIVEKFYPSNEIEVEALEGKTYQPTMRVAFILIYNNRKIDFRFLGGYWLLPELSVNDEGSLNQIYKAYCKVPFFTHAPENILEEVCQQLEETMPLLYEEMLNQR